ncbi:PKD domain containing protein [Methanocaldococcus bathoardescens]|uniref:PKD domain containing protein n=1 Tax=Methanocaldococcus bathoardescens TaxID=1301915 RepID=A0A076LFK8_9EURY|nr:PKD domain-containing protein [Methanocaldococcus bathoardescens]AIJ05238.1 PKD domain containing protein [Methanocaldococcus bathoardescens]
MRPKFLMPILFLLFFHVSFGDEVRLTPENVSVNEYDYFDLTLSVNVSEKLSGFEDTIYFPSALNITTDDIILSDIANSAFLKSISVDDGKVSISLMWSGNEPSGNFTIATLKFKALNNGTYTITQKPKLSDIDGNAIDATYNSVEVNIIGLNLTVVEITPINPKLNENFDVLISIKNAKENTYNITGTIYYPNLSIIGLDFYYLENNISNVDLNFSNGSLNFFVELNTSKENFDLMKLTFFTSKEGTYIINASVKINGNDTIVKPANFTIGEETTVERYVGFSTTEKNISYGDKGFIYIEAKNIDSNISEIKGKITYNSTLLKISDISTSLSVIEKNWTVENGTIDFDIKINGTTSGNFSILSFWIEPIKNENVTTEIKISQIYLFDKNGIVDVPLKDTKIIHIIPRENNTAPKAYFAFEIVDDYEVNFYSLCQDNENDKIYYYWDFGDGSSSTSANPSHRYKKEGNYVVKLKVNDTFGATSYDECLIEIEKLNPINITLSNKTICSNETNVTILCNITIKNPFSEKIYGYIYFSDYDGYKPNKTHISFELLPNETKVFSIPINVSKSTQIKGYVEYYMPYERLIKYIWNFKEDVEVVKPKEIKFNDYHYNLTINQSKVVIKVNKVVKNYTITKKVEIEDDITNTVVSLIGFLMGLLLIYKKGLLFP